MSSYKKRVIQANSSDEEDDTPLVKRPKPESTTNGASGSLPAPTGDVDMIDANALNPALIPPPAADATAAQVAEEKAKLAVFTTGSDSEEDVPLAAAKAGKNGKYQEESSSEDEKPLVQKAKAKKEKEVKQQVKAEEKVEKEVAKLVEKVEEQEGESSSEDEKPLASKAKSKSKNAKASSSKASGKKSKKAKAEDDEDEDMDEATESDEDDGEEDYESDAPKSKKKAPAKKKAPVVKKEVKPKATSKKAKKEEGGEDAKPKAGAKGKGKAKKEGSADQEEAKSESGDEVYRWWDQQDDGVTKWKTLEHNGVLFPPEYEAHGVKMNYNGKPVTLPPEAEEVASFFAAILETDYPKNPVFVKNFFDSWIGVMKLHPPTDGTKITSFDKCDFTPIFNYLEGEKAKKKELTTAQKKAIKAERDVVEAPYKTCLLDGRKEKVGNFRVEPPGLFRGRGEHPKTGLLKTRVRPEQITINIGKGVKVPPAPPGHKWKDVVHDDKVTWLATWKENINGAVKYVFLAAGSSLKGQSDFKKFEKARALKEHIDKIRRDYTDDLKNKETAIRQRATAIYLIDRFALRNGNEKGEDEADTVGCCSLRYEHVTLTPPTKVTFDFLGKDSIRFHNEVEVDEQVFKNLKIFKKEPKAVGDLLFDRLSTGMVNKYLTSYMDGLTAKVFRTYNASWTFVQQLKDTPKDASVADKILAYNRANRLVAVLCNHQRSVSKGHSVAMEKMADKIRALKYQRRKLRYALLADADKKIKKEYAEDESDIDDDWIIKHEENLVVLEKEKITKKFQKESKKLEEEGEKPLADSELKDRLKAADDLEKNLKSERKKGWKESKLSEAKLIAAISKMDDRIQVAKTNATDKDEGKEVSLGTSKINYIDPRITFAWCKQHGVPANKIFSKTLVEKVRRNGMTGTSESRRTKR
ncbi:hypothetical protein BCR35DRAFT_309531 [Leucosporidium creatinivorum]|uniref:DNA topoisomerase I n=1 Tax=Leucosporidium creatinivorum TaxID=106004 RepID=A0A1Y2DFE9_9BASI|nr:hypothetical protein BCR35DRAFT_309531 [Leucosporidium creatinivorum]